MRKDNLRHFHVAMNDRRCIKRTIDSLSCGSSWWYLFFVLVRRDPFWISGCVSFITVHHGSPRWAWPVYGAHHNLVIPIKKEKHQSLYLIERKRVFSIQQLIGADRSTDPLTASKSVISWILYSEKLSTFVQWGLEIFLIDENFIPVWLLYDDDDMNDDFQCKTCEYFLNVWFIFSLFILSFPGIVKVVALVGGSGGKDADPTMLFDGDGRLWCCPAACGLSIRSTNLVHSSFRPGTYVGCSSKNKEVYIIDLFMLSI